MNATFIKFETAKLAKANGFNELCFYHYSYGNGDKKIPKDGSVYNGGFLNKNSEPRRYRNSELSNWLLPYGEFTAPFQNDLKKWLKEKHEIDVTVCFYKENNITFYETYVNGIVSSGYNSYEEAFEIGLVEGIKIISIINNPITKLFEDITLKELRKGILEIRAYKKSDEIPSDSIVKKYAKLISKINGLTMSDNLFLSENNLLLRVSYLWLQETIDY